MTHLDPYTVTGLLIGALLAGVVIGALMVAVAARGRRLDEDTRAGAAFRELRDAALRHADPSSVATLMRDAATIWDRWRPDGLHLSATVAESLTPAYVHRILDAYDGRPLTFAGCWVPPDVQGRLRAFQAIGAAVDDAAGRYAASLATSIRPLPAGELQPARSGARDG